jgi:hypothetical protein
MFRAESVSSASRLAAQVVPGVDLRGQPRPRDAPFWPGGHSARAVIQPGARCGQGRCRRTPGARIECCRSDEPALDAGRGPLGVKCIGIRNVDVHDTPFPPGSSASHQPGEVAPPPDRRRRTELVHPVQLQTRADDIEPPRRLRRSSNQKSYGGGLNARARGGR